MADILIDEQAAPATPAAGQQLIWVDNAAGLGLMSRDDSGSVFPLSGNMNKSTASQTLVAATDTVVTGSRILIPSSGLTVGMVYHVRLSMSKGAVGTTGLIWTVRLGTLGTTGDASQWTHTGVAQTAVAETGFYELLCTVRSIGASGVLQATLSVVRTGGTAATGFASVPAAEVTGAGADKSWVSGQGILLSLNGGTGGTPTITQCVAELKA